MLAIALDLRQDGSRTNGTRVDRQDERVIVTKVWVSQQRGGTQYFLHPHERLLRTSIPFQSSSTGQLVQGRIT